ncbi:MAG: cytosine permease, partial [Deltaproteobacteria bacterium]|nr:cytosine permease [Deltaproteobacteria bacterium]
LLILCVVMTVVIFREYGWSPLAQVRGEPGLSFMLGLDLVIAMPISWLPLVCDYSRYSRSTGACFWGTWIGYLIVSSWMYVIGLAAALATRSSTPDAVVIQMMASIGMILPAVIIVLFSTITTTFLDIFSTAISAMNIRPSLGERGGSLAAGALGLGVALVFPATQYEHFLLFIGSMFCPLFGVVLADFFILQGRAYQPEQLFTRGMYWYWRGVNPAAFASWAVGFAVYQTASRLTWPMGASLPSFLLAGALYLILMRYGPTVKKVV